MPDRATLGELLYESLVGPNPGWSSYVPVCPAVQVEARPVSYRGCPVNRKEGDRDVKRRSTMKAKAPRERERARGRQTDRQTDKQTDRQIDRQMEKERGRERDRQG